MARTPQILPTRKVRGLVESTMRFLERVPVLGRVLEVSVPEEDSDVPLTIMVPIHRKDLWIAPAAVRYALKNVRHPVEEVVVVSRDEESIRAWADADGLRWVNEETILNYTADDIAARLPKHAQDRSRWIFQQLIKFGVEKLIKTEAFLVIDSDTLLLAPKVFKNRETVWIDYSHERNLLYLKGYRELLGEKPGSWVSFVCHHMFAEKKVIDSLKARIEEHTGKKWDDAIVELASSEVWNEGEKEMRPFNYFSEFETYLNFARDFYPEVRTRYFRNHSARGFVPGEVDLDAYVAQLPRFFQWASFHSYHVSKAGAQAAPREQDLTGSGRKS